MSFLKGREIYGSPLSGIVGGLYGFSLCGGLFHWTLFGKFVLI